jgi:hypothetical protein
MTLKIPTLEELTELRDAQASPDLGDAVVHGMLQRTFDELQELLVHEKRSAPENRDMVLALCSTETRAKIELVNRAWGVGVNLLVAIEDIGDIEKFLDVENYTSTDTQEALLKLFQDLRSESISYEVAIDRLKETVRRSNGLITPQGTSSGRIWGFLGTIAAIFPEVVDGAMGENVFTSIDRG